MKNDEFRLSINTKTIILILLLLNVGYAYKKINQYIQIKEAGYIREIPFQEQIRKRMMTSFGSVEEMERLIAEITKQKDDADKLVKTLKAQDKQINKAYKDQEDIKTKHEEEKSYLQKKIRDLANVLSELKVQYEQLGKANAELKDAKSKLELEKTHLQKKLRNLEDLIPERKNQ